MSRSNKTFTTEDLEGAKFVSAGPTRSGRRLQARFRIAGKIRCVTVRIPEHGRDPLPFEIAAIVLSNYGLTRVEATKFGRRKQALPFHLEVSTASESLRKLIEADAQELQHRHYQRQRAAKALREWMVHALRNGLSEDDLRELMRESIAQSVMDA